MKGFLIGLGMLMTVGASAETDVVRTRLCDFWKYDFESSGNVCNFLGSYVSLVEAKDYEAKVRSLEVRIAELEKRLSQLEN